MRRRSRELPEVAVRTAWQCASLLLDYPEDGDLADVRVAVASLPDPLAEPLRQFLAHRDVVPLRELQEEYVTTFDTRRRCSLFLTYFAHGDTRKRGLALLRFKQTYLASGVVLDDSELPDHLCVVLEYAATVDLAAGRQLLLDHRAGVEVLRMSLSQAGSPWAPVLDAVCRALPALRGEEAAAVQALVEAGPPAEEVGLTPYGTPGFDAALEERIAAPVAVDLPMPRLRPHEPERRGA